MSKIQNLTYKRIFFHIVFKIYILFKFKFNITVAEILKKHHGCSQPKIWIYLFSYFSVQDKTRKEENTKNDKEIENLQSKIFELEDKLMKAHESVKG